jgi:hypothetical protein
LPPRSVIPLPSGGTATREALVETDLRGTSKKYMYGILGDFNHHDFNCLETVSLELTRPIPAKSFTCCPFPFSHKSLFLTLHRLFSSDILEVTHVILYFFDPNHLFLSFQTLNKNTHSCPLNIIAAFTAQERLAVPANFLAPQQLHRI